MASKSKSNPLSDSCIGGGMHVTGRCDFVGNLRVDGTVQGDVIGDESQSTALTLGESAVVQGALSADHLTVAGHVIGPVWSRQTLVILAHARIEGDVHYQLLNMQPGAQVLGQLHPAPRVLTPAPTPGDPVAQEEPKHQTEPVETEQPNEPVEPVLDGELEPIESTVD